MTERPDVAHSNPVTQAGFITIPVVVMLRRDLSPTAKLLYGWLKHLAWRGRSDEVDPPKAALCRDLNLSDNTVTALLKELRAAPVDEDDPDSARLVVAHRRGLGKSNSYTLNDPESRTAESADPEPQDVRVPARARHSGGTSLRGVGNPKSEKQDSAREQPPEIVWVDGRNVALDTLCRVTGVDEKGPRVAQAIVALNGRLDGRTGKVKEQGIRHLFWLECVRYAEANDALDKIDLAYTDEHEGWILALAQRIEQKASKWVEVYRDAALSPQALRNHWLDLELAPSRGGMTADEIARFDG